MCTLTLSKAVIKQIDKYRKHRLWRGSDINAKNHPKATWKMVCKPKIEGGLGVIDIEKQNKALILKNFHKFFNKCDLPWVNLIWEKHYKNGKLPNHIRKGSFWWRDTLKLLPDFKSVAKPQLMNGESILFWHDIWAGQPLAVIAPELFSFAKNKMITARKAFDQEELSDLFQLPLSQTTFLQLQDIQQLM